MPNKMQGTSFCYACGATLGDDAVICPGCGLGRSRPRSCAGEGHAAAPIPPPSPYWYRTVPAMQPVWLPAPARRGQWVIPTLIGGLATSVLTIFIALVAVHGRGVRAAPDDSAAESRKPLLWRVTAANGNQSYLLGTIHVGVSLDAVPHSVRQAIDRSDVVVAETDVQADLGTLGTGPSGTGPDQPMDLQTLQANLALVQYVPDAELIRQVPRDAACALLLIKYIRSKGFLDMEVVDRALTQGKDFAFLETVEYQEHVIESEGMLECTDEDLAEFRRDPEGAAGPVREMLDAYLSGDERRLEEMFAADEDMARSSGALGDGCADRTWRWLPKVEDILTKGDAFIAVGAAHVLGPDGLLELLEDRGYRVERVGGTL